MVFIDLEPQRIRNLLPYSDGDFELVLFSSKGLKLVELVARPHLKFTHYRILDSASSTVNAVVAIFYGPNYNKLAINW